MHHGTGRCWQAMAFQISADDDLRTLAERLPMTVREGSSLRNDRVLVAD